MTAFDNAFLDRFAEFGPVSRNLSWLIRPALIAGPGKTLVWGDWSAIEARVLPWLAASPGGEKVLDVFRTNDADPSLPDIYEIEAGNIYKCDPGDIDKGPRQIGKVAVLSLGFGGSVGALGAMATGYGIYLEDDLKHEIVETWRQSNPWARTFWDQLWEAALNALESPGAVFPAGRVAFVYDPSYIRGTLFCALPCGRVLSYPKIRWEKREIEDKKTGKLEERTQLVYTKGYGRAAAWFGKFAENVTQATAGSILRRTLVWLDQFADVVAHTHDEIVREVDDDPVQIAAAQSVLRANMEANDKWDAGLPLKAEVAERWYYTKTIE